MVNKMDLYDHGDKLLAFFGAPVAHEDDPERAVRAALAMQETLTKDREAGRKTEEPPSSAALRQQIGLSYGYVFAGYVGADWQREYTVMGDEVNLAARLMSVAELGSVTVSQNVRRKVQTLFDLTPHGTVKLKGKSAPTPIFSVAGPRTIPERVQGLAGLRSPLVGREAEWGQLRAAMDGLLAGRGQIISITGDAGLGKSRLAAEMRHAVGSLAGQEAVRWVEGRCLSYTESVSYYPMLEMMRNLLGLHPDDSEAEAWSKLRQALAAAFPPDEARDHLPYLANFLSLPLDEVLHEKVRYLDAEALQRRTFVALRALIEAQANAEGRPLVIALDDLHWIDQASLALLEHLMPLVEHAPLLLLLLYRPEHESAVWHIHEKAAQEFASRSREMALVRLTPEDSQQLLTNLVAL
ncbi:MAG: AAA family ATPase, partial [Anaerolineales bacterium]